MIRMFWFFSVILVFCLKSAPAAASPLDAVCDEVMQKLSQYALGYSWDKTDNKAFWIEYKNSDDPNYSPRKIFLTEPSAFEPHTLYRRKEEAQEVNRTTEYDARVITLRKGDTVVFGKKEFRLGDYLGSEEKSNVYKLADRPGEVIKIPLLVDVWSAVDENIDRIATGRRQIKRLVENYDAVKKLKVKSVDLIEWGKNYEYAILTEINGHETAWDYLGDLAQANNNPLFEAHFLLGGGASIRMRDKQLVLAKSHKISNLYKALKSMETEVSGNRGNFAVKGVNAASQLVWDGEDWILADWPWQESFSPRPRFFKK